MEGGRLFLLRSGRDQISKGEGWSNHSLVLISTEIMNTIPFPVFGQFLRNSVGGRPDSRLRCGRRPRPPTPSPSRVSARGVGLRAGARLAQDGRFSSSRNSYFSRSEAKEAKVWTRRRWPGGRSESQCASPGGWVVLALDPFTLKRKTGAEDQHRGGRGAFEQFPGAYLFLGEKVLL